MRGYWLAVGAIFDQDLNEARSMRTGLAALEEFVRRGKGSVFERFYDLFERRPLAGYLVSTHNIPQV